jgi:arsenite-transporting ATPase
VRLLLFTGKGGVGKTTASAATGRRRGGAGEQDPRPVDRPRALARRRARHPAHGEPTEVDTGLYAMQVDTQAAFERTWRDVQGYLLGLLERAGVDALQAEELTVLPGRRGGARPARGQPSGDDRPLGPRRRRLRADRRDAAAARAAGGAVLVRRAGLPGAATGAAGGPARCCRGVSVPAVPRDDLFDAVERLHRELLAVRAVLTAPSTSVRVVLTPEAVVVAEARRTLTSLALYGYRVDALVANRVFPSGSAEPFLAGWAAAQAEQLAAVRADAGGLPVLVSPYLATEPVGLADLTALGQALYGSDDPAAEGATTSSWRSSGPPTASRCRWRCRSRASRTCS